MIEKYLNKILGSFGLKYNSFWALMEKSGVENGVLVVHRGNYLTLQQLEPELIRLKAKNPNTCYTIHKGHQLIHEKMTYWTNLDKINETNI